MHFIKKYPISKNRLLKQRIWKHPLITQNWNRANIHTRYEGNPTMFSYILSPQSCPIIKKNELHELWSSNEPSHQYKEQNIYLYIFSAFPPKFWAHGRDLRILLLFCECRWSGKSMWRWWVQLHTPTLVLSWPEFGIVSISNCMIISSALVPFIPSWETILTVQADHY